MNKYVLVPHDQDESFKKFLAEKRKKNYKKQTGNSR